jgi:RimJ/RimL family protein N-acetyltransferase
MTLPVGPALPGWHPRPAPQPLTLTGNHCRLEPLDAATHAAALHAALEGDDAGWTYMGYGPFATPAATRAWVAQWQGRPDPMMHAILDAQGPAGVAALLRPAPEHGCVELGHIRLAPRLQRTTAATEALALMIAHVFDTLGYRRLEWKCDALNAASRRAAARLGFAFEGVFRNHMVVKGRSRDTAWFAMTDSDWRRLGPGYAAWLAETGDGQQRRPLAAHLPPAG